MIKKLLAFSFLLFLFLGCTKKTDVQIPAYIQIDNYFTKVASDSSQGTNNQKFTDMLVYANGKTYGIYPLGAKIPVLTSAATSFIIRGVIRVNGVDALRADYEVMKGCDTTINVTPGQVTHVTPVFEYFAAAKFRWMADFEPASQVYGGFVSSYGAHPTLTATKYTPGFGNYGTCLALKSTADSIASVQTKAAVILPTGGVGVYLELNYLANTTLHILINGTDGGSINPSASWNKMYINLTEQVSSLQATNYTISFYSDYNPNVGANLTLIDNLKIVTAL